MSDVKWDAPELAERYDRISDLQFHSGCALVARMGLKAGDRALDVGCGTGRLALYVSTIVGPSGSVTGIDPSPHRVRVAEGKLRGREFPNVCFAIGQGEDLSPLPDNAFDHVYYSSVFHWIGDKAAALSEACRVLKPGGCVGMTTVDRGHALAMKQMYEKAFSDKYEGQTGMDDMSKMLISHEELYALLREAGFCGAEVCFVPERLCYSSAKEFTSFIEASSFGNFLRNVPESVRLKAIEDLEGELERHRSGAGIELESRTMYAIARKPGFPE